MDLSRGQKLLIIIGLFALLGGIVVLSLGKLSSAPASVVYEAPRAPAQPQYTAVHVVGAVVHPNMYWLRPGSRVSDAIDAAGGMAPEADQSSVNLAAVLQDGQQVKVMTQTAPVAAATTPPPAPAASPVPAPATQALPAAPAKFAKTPNLPLPLSLNQATKDQLQALPGIGPELAARIVYYRYEHGGFRSVEELSSVDGIGPGRLELLRSYLKL